MNPRTLTNIQNTICYLVLILSFTGLLCTQTMDLSEDDKIEIYVSVLHGIFLGGFGLYIVNVAYPNDMKNIVKWEHEQSIPLSKGFNLEHEPHYKYDKAVRYLKAHGMLKKDFK